MAERTAKAREAATDAIIIGTGQIACELLMPRKRAVPEYISHIIMAKEYTSAALVSFPCFNSSGEQ
jgi:hypothetical protein